jgi:hypothetical protein
VILTGRFVIVASFAATISWLNGSLFPPKPPPLGQAMMRMREGAIPSTFDVARWR